MNALAFFEIGFSEMVVVGIVALLLFGGRLPDVMRTLGASYRSFRRGFDDLSRQAMRPDLMAPPYQPIPPAATKPPAGATHVPPRTSVPAPWASAAPAIAAVTPPTPSAPAPVVPPSSRRPPRSLDDDVPFV